MRAARGSAAVSACVLVAACQTASILTIDSEPRGARIYVQSVDTGRTTPATLDLEDYAPDPDRSMPVEVRLPGHVPTTTLGYEKRHQCDQWICEHARRHLLPATLPLLEAGTGIRIDTDDSDCEVRVDGGPWQPVNGKPGHRSVLFGLTIPLSPGLHEFEWRRLDRQEEKVARGSRYPVAVPPAGYVAIDFDMLPNGMNAQRDATH